MLDKALQQYIERSLRRAWSRSLARRQCLENAKEVYFIGKMRRVRFKCAHCGKWFNRDEVQVDHIAPVRPIGGFDSWDATLERLFVGPEGLQVLCKPDHKEKSKEEAGGRAASRKSQKSPTSSKKRKKVSTEPPGAV